MNVVEPRNLRHAFFCRPLYLMQYRIGYLGGQWIKCRSFGIRFAAASGHTNFGYTHKQTNNWRIELNSQFGAILISSIHLCSDGYREVFSCVLELLVMEFHLPRYRTKKWFWFIICVWRTEHKVEVKQLNIRFVLWVFGFFFGVVQALIYERQFVVDRGDRTTAIKCWCIRKLRKSIKTELREGIHPRDDLLCLPIWVKSFFGRFVPWRP